MASIDKNQAVVDFLMTYEDIQTIPLFFNFINAKDNNIQFLTSSNDKDLNKQFIDGSVLRRYEFSLLITKSITDMAMVNGVLTNENVEDIADIQKVMDWINEQNDLQNFPNFGDKCVVEEMHTLSDNPSLDGINTEVSPALAMYSMAIRIDYIDYNKVIWS